MGSRVGACDGKAVRKGLPSHVKPRLLAYLYLTCVLDVDSHGNAFKKFIKGSRFKKKSFCLGLSSWSFGVFRQGGSHRVPMSPFPPFPVPDMSPFCLSSLQLGALQPSLLEDPVVLHLLRCTSN